MANKKAEILTMDGQVVSPITLATSILLDDGRTAQDLLDSRDESMFSPTITTSSSISKVGQGDNVDFSENVIDGAYKSCVLKGKTLVNYNAEGNDRNEYVCMPSVEGSDLTVNGTVEGYLKSAILKGQTLVNLLKVNKDNYIFNQPQNWSIEDEYFKCVSTTSWHTVTDRFNNMIKPSTKYLIVVEIKENTLNIDVRFDGFGTALNSSTTYLSFNSNEVGIKKVVITTPSTIDSTKNGLFRMPINVPNKGSILKFRVMAIEYQDGMENWDIPYFEGMQSVRMPVLATFTENGNLSPNNEWFYEQGTINGSTGLLEENPLRIRTKNFIPFDGEKVIFENTGNLAIRCYDEKKTLIYNGTFAGFLQKNIVYSVPTGTKYIKLVYAKTDYNLPITPSEIANLNTYVSKGTALIKEPFKSNILSTPSDLVLRGIGDVKDTLDCLTGEVVERVGEVVLDGSESWTKYQNTFYTRLDTLPRDSDYTSIIMCSDLPVLPTVSHLVNANKGVTGYTKNSSYVGENWVYVKFEDVNDVDALKMKLSENPITVQYHLANESIKTVVLSDNVVYSYKDTTHYTCSSQEGSLLPTLAIEEGVKYEAIIKPSTKYSIVFNRTEVASGLTVDLGGATANITSTTLGKNIVQITTPPTLSHNYVIFKGLGNVIKDVQVIEGEVVGDEPYFEGMVDVKNPVVTNTGKNLYNGVNSVGFVSDSTGTVNPAGVDWLVTDFVKVERNKTYTFSEASIFNGLKKVAIYDSDKNFLTMSNTLSFTPSENGYVRFNAKLTTGGNVTDFVNQAQIQLEESSTPTAYEPYKSNTITTEQTDGSIITLRKVGDVSDTLDLETGEYVQRIGEVVYDGSDDENWDVAYINVDGLIGIATNIPSDMKYLGANRIDGFINDRLKQAVSENMSIYSGYGGWSMFAIYMDSSTFDSAQKIKQWLSQNPITVQYELATPIITTIDLKQHPFAYKDGYVVLTSSSEEVSLTPTIEYSLIANRLGQIQSNQKLVEKQQAQIDELESMVVANLVNTQYQQALNEIKLGVK